jgi:hypothetical protein
MEKDGCMTKIKYRPFVGKKYLAGIQGKRFLTLGESFYAEKPDEVSRDLMSQLVEWYVDEDRYEHEGWMNTYTKYIRALAGEEISRKRSEAWWNRIALYDFVQEPMAGPRVSPMEQQFRDSDEAFFEVLEQLRPDCVIAWGKRLYNNLPHAGYQGEDCMEQETWIYELRDGHQVRILPIDHPSIADFDWTYWHKVIQSWQF